MVDTTKNEAKPLREIAYYTQRYRNRVYHKLISFIAEQCEAQQLTRKDIAHRIRKDPAQISRLLAHPTNLTLDSISELLLAVDAEAEPPEMVQFKDKVPANYMHPLVARALNIEAADTNARLASDGEKTLVLSNPVLNVEASMAVS
jgi:hypothetical protein